MLKSLRAKDDGTTPQNYLYACRGCDPSIVTRVARSFIEGGVDGVNKAFPPTTAEFATEVRRWMPTPRTPSLPADDRPPPTQEQKDRVDALLAGLKEGTAMENLNERKERMARQHDEIMQKLRDHVDVTGDLASPRLRKMMEEERAHKQREDHRNAGGEDDRGGYRE